MHQGKLKAAVKKYQPLVAEDKTEEEIKEALAADDKGYSEDEITEILSAILTPDTGDDGKEEEEENKAGYKVALMFRDKHSQQVYSPGDDYTPRNENRAAELIKKGVIKKG